MEILMLKVGSANQGGVF